MLAISLICWPASEQSASMTITPPRRRAEALLAGQLTGLLLPSPSVAPEPCIISALFSTPQVQVVACPGPFASFLLSSQVGPSSSSPERSPVSSVLLIAAACLGNVSRAGC